jgi:hypothetical protein
MMKYCILNAAELLTAITDEPMLRGTLLNENTSEFFVAETPFTVILATLLEKSHPVSTSYHTPVLNALKFCRFQRRLFSS